MYAGGLWICRLIYHSAFISSVIASGGVMFGMSELRVLPKRCDAKRKRCCFNLEPDLSKHEYIMPMPHLHGCASTIFLPCDCKLSAFLLQIWTYGVIFWLLNHSMTGLPFSLFLGCRKQKSMHKASKAHVVKFLCLFYFIFYIHFNLPFILYLIYYCILKVFGEN